MDTRVPTANKKKIMVALQGGGAHTAYAWGVMDELLANEDYDIVAIGGTSGGALIAAIVASALSAREKSGELLPEPQRRALAQEKLKQFWLDVSTWGDLLWNPYRFVAHPFYRSWNIDCFPAPILLGAMSAITSPYFSVRMSKDNPVSFAIHKAVDFDVLDDSDKGPGLYICATNVRTGQPHIFSRRKKMTYKHLLASACLPMVDFAIEIDGEYYWDGGYVSDPALTSLIDHHSGQTRDLVIVGVNPVVTGSVASAPMTPWEISDRMNELTFNSSLIAELKQIHALNELIAQVAKSAKAMNIDEIFHDKKEIFVHYIPPDEAMLGLGVASKNNTIWPFLQYLACLGRKTAGKWISGEVESGGAALLGVSSDKNFKKLFIDPQAENAAPVASSDPYVAH